MAEGKTKQNETKQNKAQQQRVCLCDDGIL